MLPIEKKLQKDYRPAVERLSSQIVYLRRHDDIGRLKTEQQELPRELMAERERATTAEVTLNL
jgi:hypothetical protein